MLQWFFCPSFGQVNINQLSYVLKHIFRLTLTLKKLLFNYIIAANLINTIDYFVLNYIYYGRCCHDI